MMGTKLRDCAASLLSCTYEPKRKIGRLYAGTVKGLIVKANTCAVQ
jgi:hypothetical protein